MNDNAADTPTGEPSVASLHIALATRLPMRKVESIEIETGAGIVGDRYHGTKHRHVTVQSLTELGYAEDEIDRPIDPNLTRRNVTLSHGDLPRKPGTQFMLGEVKLEVVRDAAPCKLLEDTLGRNAKLALHKRAGVVCRVLAGGTVTLGSSMQQEV